MNKSIEELIIDFKNDERIDYLLRPTIFEIYAKRTSELAHTSFLATLFDSSKNVGYKDIPLKKLIKLLEEKMPNTFDKYISKENILFENYELSNIRTTANALRLNGKEKLYIDLLIEFSYFSIITNKLINYSIIVENKINSKEYDEQTKSYYKIENDERIDKEKKANQNILYENVYIYLTPSRKGKIPTCDKFIWITYADLYEYIIEPLSRKNYEQNYLYHILLDYQKLLTKIDTIDFKVSPNHELINSIKNDYSRLFDDKNLNENDKVLLNEFQNTYEELFNILNIKGAIDSYDFDDLGLNSENRLYFSSKKTAKDITTNITKEDILEKYEIYPEGNKGVVLFEGDSSIPKRFTSITKLIQYLYDKENVKGSIANGKDNVYVKENGIFYSLTQLRKIQLNNE